MEELFVFAILLYEQMVTKDKYDKRLDKLFLDDPENEGLLYPEQKTDIKKAIIYIKTHIGCNALDCERFSKILMNR